jgi:hypothetical protein
MLLRVKQEYEKASNHKHIKTVKLGELEWTGDLKPSIKTVMTGKKAYDVGLIVSPICVKDRNPKDIRVAFRLKCVEQFGNKLNGSRGEVLTPGPLNRNSQGEIIGCEFLILNKAK